MQDESKKHSLRVSLGKTAQEGSPDDPVIEISDKLRKAFAEEIILRKGLVLIINEYTLSKKVRINFNVEIPPLEFAFCASGSTVSRVMTKDKGQIDLALNKDMSTIFYFPNSEGYIDLSGEGRVRVLSLHIDPLFLYNFVDRDFENVPAAFMDFLQHGAEKSYFMSGKMPSSMQIAVQQVFECNYTGLTRKMFLESKALELMTLQIQQLETEKEIALKKIDLRQDEIDRIISAKDFLVDKLSDPPTLSELARSAGLTHTRLNYGFRQLFKTTVFEYLRNERLEHSRLLLEDGKLNITEIAYETGYSSPSHFSREFLKRFGIQPREYRKNKS